MDMIIPTNLVCILFSPPIPTSPFNFIVFCTCSTIGCVPHINTHMNTKFNTGPKTWGMIRLIIDFNSSGAFPMTMDLHNHPWLLLTPPISDQKYSEYDLLIVLANNYYRSLSTHLCFGGSLIPTAPLICMGCTTYADDVTITIILI